MWMQVKGINMVSLTKPTFACCIIVISLSMHLDIGLWHWGIKDTENTIACKCAIRKFN
jgi:hypothetical protein